MMIAKKKEMNFDALVSALEQVHVHLAAQAGRAINISLTLRNWVMGAYIAEYELAGADRAVYGESLLAKLADELEKKKVSACGKRQLYNYLRFYNTYPEIVRSVTAQLEEALPFPLRSPLNAHFTRLSASGGTGLFGS